MKTNPITQEMLLGKEGLFWSKIEISESGCWNWKGAIDRYGYGIFQLNKKALKAHRVGYALIKGKAPDGLVLDHLCYNPACVNPNHLEPKTSIENIQANADRKTHCYRGHKYTPQTTRLFRNARVCLLCRRPRDAALKRKQRDNK